MDIVLLDFDLEDDTGTRFIASATAAGYRGKILMVTAWMSPLDVAVARKLGISGLFLKHNSPDVAARGDPRGGRRTHLDGS